MRAVWKKLSRPSVTRCRWHTQQRCFTDSAAGTSVVAAASTPAASDAIPSSAAPSTAAAAESVIAGTLASDPKVEVPTLPDIDPAAIAASEKAGGMRGIRDEVNRVMANPEIDGNPIALDFSSKGRSSGYNRKFASNYDDIFRKKK